MSLSSELISQFAKITNDKTEVKQEYTHYGTTVEYDGSMYVQLDGSDLLTPISTTADTKAGERVMVLIKNHTVTITGNLSSPAARTGTVTELDGKVTNLGSQISEFEVIIADKVDTVVLQAVVGRVDQLTSDNVIIKEHLDANTADIDSLEADNVVINEKLTAAEGDIKKLNTEKLSAKEAEIKFANIDFSNIGTAAIEEFLAKSGLIDDLTVGDGIVTGKLVGVTIIGDLIEGGTVKADKLVVKGTDGIYYKLNFEGGNFAEGEAVPDDSLHGSIITAKSITAEKVSVKDLVAFGATIGGFKITDNAIHSVAKTSATNATRGLYMDNEGQMSFGDTTRYLKYYKDQNGVWHLEIAADDILFGADGESVDTVLRGVTADVDEVKAKAEKAQSDAEAANAAAERVQARAEAAETAATTAQTKADEAKAKAEQAEANLTEVSSRVDATEEEIELATLVANTAKAEAEAAQSQADTAKAQAEQAKTDAENAKTIANTAKSAADKAQADVNALATRVTNAETAISQNYEAIELRATKTEVEKAIAGIEVGGRNLLPKVKYSTEITDISENSKSGFGFIAPGLQTGVTVPGSITGLSLKTNRDYTVSFIAWLDTTDNDARQSITWDLWPDNLPQEFIYSGLSNVPTKYEWTIRSDQAEMAECNLRFIIFEADSEGYTSKYPVYITDIKLEEGNVATDWTAAPEDAEYAIFEAKSLLALAEQNLQNLEARAGTTEEELKSAQQEVINAQSAVEALMNDLLTTKQSMADLKVQAEDISIEVTKIVKYGVDKVTTKTGYTFGEYGLKIQKDGQEIVNTLDDEGMSVTRGEEVMLQADKDGVIATDVKVRNYLIIGKHARFEDYNDGTDSKRTACFWVDL